MAMYSTHYTSYDKDGRVIGSGTFTTTSPYSGISYDSNGGYTRYSSSLISSDPPSPPSSGTPNNSNTTPSPGSSGGSGYSGSGYVPPKPTNKPPEISGSDEDLGDKNKEFIYEYTVKDEDEVRVDISINQKVIESIENAPRGQVLKLTVTNEMIKELTVGEVNHIVLKVTDKKNAYSLRNLTFKRVNAAPKIVLETDIPDLKDVDKTFTVRYVAIDDEGDSLKGRILIDQVGGDLEPIQNGKQVSYSLPHLRFIQLHPGEHTISAEVVDDKGQRAVESIYFTRTAREIVLWLDPCFSTSTLVERINTAYTIVKGGARATIKVEACNNANDDSPAWEDITSSIENKQLYTFINKNHSNATGLNIRFTIQSNGEPKETILKGFSGRIA